MRIGVFLGEFTQTVGASGYRPDLVDRPTVALVELVAELLPES